jgi:hypothetical protein
MLRGVRLSARYNIAQLKRGRFAVSLCIASNFPVVDFPIDAEITRVLVKAGSTMRVVCRCIPLPAYTCCGSGTCIAH